MTDPSATTLARLTHEIAAASTHETAREVVDRLDLGRPAGAAILADLVVATMAQRLSPADTAVTVTVDGGGTQLAVTDGELPAAEGTPAWDRVVDAIATGHGRLVAQRLGADGPIETLAWDLQDGFAWPAHGDLDGAHPGPPLWQAALADQRDEQRRTSHALRAGEQILAAVLDLIPAGAATLHIVDTGPDREVTLVRDERGAHAQADPQALQAELALVGGPVAFGSGAVTLALHTGSEQDDSAELRAWRVEPGGVVALTEHELRSEFAPHWFDRHRGLSYVAAPQIPLD